MQTAVAAIIVDGDAKYLASSAGCRRVLKQLNNVLERLLVIQTLFFQITNHALKTRSAGEVLNMTLDDPSYAVRGPSSRTLLLSQMLLRVLSWLRPSALW